MPNASSAQIMFFFTVQPVYKFGLLYVTINGKAEIKTKFLTLLKCLNYWTTNVKAKIKTEFSTSLKCLVYETEHYM